MIQPLAAEILRIVTSPYAVSLINLEAILKAADADEIALWAHSNPCRIKALVKAALDALEYCPYALSVIERLAGSARLRNEILEQKPIILSDLMRVSIQDSTKFKKYSPVLIGLLSNPLPSKFPPPSPLVSFFLECLDRATAEPSIETIRPLYIPVANGYNHLALQMTESQSHAFASRMASLLQAPKTISDMNLFLVYCLTTLAYMHMASTESSSRPFAVLFEGKKAPWVLGLIIPIVYQCSSSETQVNIRDKIHITRMATVVANALSQEMKMTKASEKDKANLQRLLEKAKTHDNLHLLLEVLQFVSALSIIVPPKNLNATLKDILCRAILEGKACVALPLMTTDFYNTLPPLISTILRSIYKEISTDDELASSFLQDRIDFVKALCSSAPQLPDLRRQILLTATEPELISFINHSSPAPDSAETCTGICHWTIFRLRMQLRQSLCTLLLQCNFYSPEALILNPATSTQLMDIVTKAASISYDCPLSCSLRTRHQNSLGLVEEFASPEMRISSSNWRSALCQALSQDTNRQHAYIVSAVSEICRDLERRCENVEEPLRTAQENALRIQSELEEYRLRCVEADKELAEERKKLVSNRHQLENETGRASELEELLQTEREEGRRIVMKLERESLDARVRYEEEIKAVKEKAEREAMEHFVVLNERQETIDGLQAERDGLRKKFAELQEDLMLQREAKARLETNVENLNTCLVDIRHDLRNSRESIDRTKREMVEVEEHLQKNIAVLETDLLNEKETSNGLKTSLVKITAESKEQQDAITELTHGKRYLELKIQEMQQARQTFEKEQETSKERLIREIEQKHENTIMELNCKHHQKLLDLASEQSEQLTNMNKSHEVSLEEIRKTFETELSERDRNHSENLEIISNDHVTVVGHLQEKLDCARENIRTLNEKIGKLYAFQEERTRETQNLGLKLMSLMTKSDFSTLLGPTTAVETHHLEQEAISSADKRQRSRTPVAIVPGRRKSEDFIGREDGAKKRTKLNRQPIQSEDTGATLRQEQTSPIRATEHSEIPLAKTVLVGSEGVVRDRLISLAGTDHGSPPMLANTPAEQLVDLSPQFDRKHASLSNIRKNTAVFGSEASHSDDE